MVLFVASLDVALSKELLDQHHVTHILNLAPDVQPAYPEHFQYKTVPILDIPETNIISYFPQCFEVLDDAVKSDGCVLVHCKAGVSRAAAVVIGYLIRQNDMDYQQAFDFVKSKRPSIKPNPGFVAQLKEYSLTRSQTL